MQEQCRCRCRNRKNAVCAVNMAASCADRGCKHCIRGQHLHQQADADHIRHGVQRTHFMEVNFLNRAAVHPAFRIRNQRVDCFGICFYAV